MFSEGAFEIMKPLLLIIPVLRLPRSSGSFVHVRAQCPRLPQRAHLVRSISEFFVHIFGRAWFREDENLSDGGGGTEPPLVIAFIGGFRPKVLDGGLLLKKPRLRVFL